MEYIRLIEECTRVKGHGTVLRMYRVHMGLKLMGTFCLKSEAEAFAEKLQRENPRMQRDFLVLVV